MRTILTHLYLTNLLVQALRLYAQFLRALRLLAHPLLEALRLFAHPLLQALQLFAHPLLEALRLFTHSLLQALNFLPRRVCLLSL